MSKIFKALPLFRLPTILLKKISRYMHLQEILLISLASKKSAFIMRYLLPLNWFNLKLLFFSGTTKVVLGAKRLWDPVIVKSRNIGDLFQLQVTQPSGDVSYQWAGPQLQELVKILLTHFATVFNPTIYIHVDKGYSQEFVMGVLKHVQQLSLMITSLQIYANISPENYRNILDECKEVSELSLFCEVAAHFKHCVGPHFRVDDFLVSDGHWVHLEDFTNCKRVSVWNSTGHKQPKYTNPEVLRAFIRKWIESECRLEYLEVYGGRARMDFRVVLSGLDYRTIEQTEYSHDVEITRRCDGKKATVKCGTYHFEFTVIY
ncbi:hypothetical protein CRE_04240 [Caenorhabditis remanei]|uniref:F-box domain-containing protein n=1 Tax=Caenorhabditis remanei TaxID=31234 RepID=E3MYW8_CAERE|nr:hypothetical protein CRE_04240 [Caenorhabditis remanei]